MKKYQVKKVNYLSEVLKGNRKNFYNNRDWKHKRKEILKRDHYECQRCNGVWKSDYPIDKPKLTTASVVHHVKDLAEYPALALDDDNLKSLCYDCHNIVEGRTQRGNFRPKKQPITIEKW